MKKQLINVQAVLTDRILSDATIAYENGMITYVGTQKQTADETIDGGGNFIFPGFVDLHCHGGADLDFMDASAQEMLKIAHYHLSHGTTSLLATTMTDHWSAIENVLSEYEKLYRENNLLTLCGVHLEGPWLSPKQCGAQDAEKMDIPSVEKLKTILKKYPFVRRVSVAPELDGGFEVGRAGNELGVIMSIAHTDADFATTLKASENGYTLLTHFYSGMTGVIRKNAFRVAGTVEAGYYSDELLVEIIADGKHLPKELLKLICKIKGPDKICLITDAIRASGLAEGSLSVLGRRDGGVPVVVEDNVAKLLDRQSFAGSVATADRLVKTMYELAQADLVSIGKMMSTTPARVLGLGDRGSIEVGKRADLVCMNDRLDIEKIIFKGEIYHEA